MRSYEEGPVTIVTSVKIVDRQYDNYMDYLAKTCKPVMEAQKQAGLIVRYGVYDRYPRSKEEADLYLVVTDPNMASFDGLRDKSEAVASKVTGLSREKATLASVDRNKVRSVLGDEMIREVILK
ncbi:MAG: hypothetical protein J7507_07905, partial [Pseudoxanthomonas sp.]|nr:hypothetical protein [Pseudoxanthomonas sp.]